MRINQLMGPQPRHSDREPFPTPRELRVTLLVCAVVIVAVLLAPILPWLT